MIGDGVCRKSIWETRCKRAHYGIICTVEATGATMLAKVTRSGTMQRHFVEWRLSRGLNERKTREHDPKRKARERDPTR